MLSMHASILKCWWRRGQRGPNEAVTHAGAEGNTGRLGRLVRGEKGVMSEGSYVCRCRPQAAASSYHGSPGQRHLILPPAAWSVCCRPVAPA